MYETFSLQTMLDESHVGEKGALKRLPSIQTMGIH